MKPLIYYLNIRSPQDLSRIAEIWEASLGETMVSGGAYELAQEMQSEFLQRRIFLALNPTQLKLLEALLKQTEFSASRLELHKLLPHLNESQLNLTLEQLQKMGIVFELRVKVAADDPEGTLVEQTAPAKGWGQLYGSRRIPQPVETARYKLIHLCPAKPDALSAAIAPNAKSAIPAGYRCKICWICSNRRISKLSRPPGAC
jgi:hypothetical protein